MNTLPRDLARGIQAASKSNKWIKKGPTARLTVSFGEDLHPTICIS